MRRPLFMIVVTLAVVFLAAGVAHAASPTTIIEDASDGTVDGTYSAKDVRAALAVVRGDPVYSMYSDVEGVLFDYLGSVGGPVSGGGGSKGGGGSGATSGGATSGGGSAASGGQTASSKNGGAGTGQGAGATGTGGSPAATVPLPPTQSSSGKPLPAADTQSWRVRLAALPWMFVALCAVAVAGVVLFRRNAAR